MAKRFTFFDERAVQNALDKGTRRALSKFGAFVRARAKSSIRKRKSVSKPGSPPSSHTGKLKKHIYFGYDVQRKSVVIGALPFSSSRAQELLEHGGASRPNYGRRPRTFYPGAFGPMRSSDVFDRKRWTRLHTAAQAVRATKIYNEVVLTNSVVYRPRPYMNPAFQKELGNLKTSFQDCIRN